MRREKAPGLRKGRPGKAEASLSEALLGCHRVPMGFGGVPAELYLSMGPLKNLQVAT